MRARSGSSLRNLCGCFLVGLAILSTEANAQTAGAKTSAQSAMDRDLMEVTVPQLEEIYRNHRYTVTEVVQWYMARIARYNGIYRAVQNVDVEGALAAAKREDAEAAAGGTNFRRDRKSVV